MDNLVLVQMAQTVVYLLEAFILLFVAKQVYARVFRRVDLSPSAPMPLPQQGWAADKDVGQGRQRMG